MTNREMPVVEHLSELRKRIIVSLVSVAVVGLMIYSKVSLLINVLMEPIGKFHIELVYFTLMEGFMTRVEVSLYAAVILVSPIILYELIAFVNPGLSAAERKLLYQNFFVVCFLFICGVLLGYRMILPHVLSFLITYGTSYLSPILSGSKYFNFIGLFCILTGFTFLLPYAITLLGKASLVSYSGLKKRRIQVVLVALAIAGSLIPTADLLTVVMIAAPVVLLYEISLWIVYFAERKKRQNNLRRT